MTQHPSQVMYAISINPGLRNRIEAIVRKMWWLDLDADPTAYVPVDTIAWSVATNPTIFASVEAAIEADDVAAAVDAIAEGDLEYQVTAALERLAGPTE